MVWAVWKVRNDKVMGEKAMELFTVGRYYSETLMACQINAYQSGIIGAPETRSNQLVPEGGDCTCYVDSSWSIDGKAGVGAMLLHNGNVTRWVSKEVNAMNAMHAEALAVLEGYQLLKSGNCLSGTVLSDCLEIVDSLVHKNLVIHDWRSFNTIWEALLTQKEMEDRFRTNYCNREDRELRRVHILANLGRLNGGNTEGSHLDFSVLDSVM